MNRTTKRYIVAPTSRPDAGGRLFNIFQVNPDGTTTETAFTPSYNETGLQAFAAHLNENTADWLKALASFASAKGMQTRTYTVLVTVTDDKPPTPEGLSNHIDTALNAGAHGFRGYTSASADVFEGDHVQPSAETARAKSLHAELRRSM